MIMLIILICLCKPKSKSTFCCNKLHIHTYSDYIFGYLKKWVCDLTIVKNLLQIPKGILNSFLHKGRKLLADFYSGYWLTTSQLFSKANFQALNFSKKRTNEFVFSCMRRVFVRFLEEIKDSKKAFRN